MIVTLEELRVLRGAAWRMHLEYSRDTPPDRWAEGCWTEVEQLDALIRDAQVVKPF